LALDSAPKAKDKMANKTTDDVTAEVAKEFDTYYRECFWEEINGEKTKKMKMAELEPDRLKMSPLETIAIGIAAVDYFILNSIDDVLGDDESRTTFVMQIHEMAVLLKAKHGALFDGAAIAKAFRAMNWQR
jgi:hypothetical protein